MSRVVRKGNVIRLSRGLIPRSPLGRHTRVIVGAGSHLRDALYGQVSLLRVLNVNPCSRHSAANKSAGTLVLPQQLVQYSFDVNGGWRENLPWHRRLYLFQPASRQACRWIGVLGYPSENRKTVVCRYLSPGFSSVDGKFGWFGESGKCCVSKQKPLRNP